MKSCLFLFLQHQNVPVLSSFFSQNIFLKIRNFDASNTKRVFKVYFSLKFIISNRLVRNMKARICKGAKDKKYEGQSNFQSQGLKEAIEAPHVLQ